MKAPIPDSYWVVPGRFLAGEYPGAETEAAAREKIRLFSDAGITLLLDLTEAGEYGLLPYETLLEEGMRTVRRPIRDLGHPSDDEMHEILDLIDAELQAGANVYVHCYGGVGRTGTVVGCWLVGHGRTGEEALAQIAEWRERTPDGSRESPEMPEQIAMVRRWA